MEALQHWATWNEAASRMEMHLVASEAQVVTLPGVPDAAGQAGKGPRFRLALEERDHIVTKHSHKFTLDGFRDLTDDAGWVTRKTWTDSRSWFAVRLLEWRRRAHLRG